MPAPAFPDIGERLLENWPWILLAVILTLAAIGWFWRFLPHRVERFLRWLDSLLPGDFSPLHRPLSQLLVALWSVAVLFLAGVSIASSLGMDTSTLLNGLREWGLTSLRWVLARLAKVIVIIVLSYVPIRLIGRTMPGLVGRYLSRRAGERLVEGEIEKRAKTLSGVLQKTATFFVLAGAFLMVLGELGINIAPLLAGAGVAGIAIGFAAQNLIRDFIAGALILLEDHYRLGDVVSVAGVSGVVEDINLRRTLLRDLDFVVHTVPNGEIRVASNMTKEKSRANLNIEVAYKEDLDRVIAILNRIGQEMYDDPTFGPLMNEPLKVLRVDGFLDSSIAIKVLGETKPIQQWTAMGEFRRRVKKAFDEEGIEIPFPHRTIYWGKDVETVIRRVHNRMHAGKPDEAEEPAEKKSGEGG